MRGQAHRRDPQIIAAVVAGIVLIAIAVGVFIVVPVVFGSWGV